MKKPNIFWILTDSIRPYYSNDKFSKLKIYDEIKKEGILFNNVTSSASSTIMSISAILTGKWAYNLGYSYDSFNFIFDNYLNYLKKEGYNITSTICFKEGAEVFRNILNPIDYKYIKNVYKNNTQLKTKESYKNFVKILNNNLSNIHPNFVYIHLRAGDLNQNKYTSKIIEKLKEKDLYETSIIIISSDHGYYDPKKHNKLKFLHYDTITEESIKSILFVKFPEYITNKKNIEINTQISNIDLFETIFDYLKISHNINNLNAISFKRIIEAPDIKIKRFFNERKIRSDTRYLMQLKKKTAIKNKYYKLVYSNKKFYFYDLIKDPLEKNNLINIKEYKNEINIFKKELISSNINAKADILDSLNFNFLRSNLKKIKNKEIIIYKKTNPYLIKYLIKKFNKNNIIKVLNLKEIKKIKNSNKTIVLIFSWNKYLIGFKKIIKLCYNNKLNFKVYNFAFKEYNPPFSFLKIFLNFIWKNKLKYLQKPTYLLVEIYRIYLDKKAINKYEN